MIAECWTNESVVEVWFEINDQLYKADTYQDGIYRIIRVMNMMDEPVSPKI